MNVGPQTLHAYGVARTAGVRLPWLWAATPANCLDGTYLDLERRSALEHALIARFGTLGKVEVPFLLRSDNGLVFTSRKYTALVKSYGLQQEFITPHCPQQNGMMERLIRSLKAQCVHRQRFESLAHASRAIGDWIQFYNNRRPR